MQDEKLVGQLARIADALEELVRAAKEKENLPPTPPIREKEKVQQVPPRACAREGAPIFTSPRMEDLEEKKGQLPPREIMEEIAKAYRANINTMISKAAAGIIERALSAGMEPATVILAIEETGMASRPSPYYLSAVLRNWAENGVVVSRARDIGVKTTEARPWWM